jgi:hypothetical protein
MPAALDCALMTAIRLKQLLILLGCACGGAISLSLLLCIGAAIYFGNNYSELSSFLAVTAPVAHLCGVAFGIAVFARTRGRGYLRGLGGGVQPNAPTDDLQPPLR